MKIFAGKKDFLLDRLKIKQLKRCRKIFNVHIDLFTTK